ncbi:MAG: DUF6624 domain-containing protein [Erythrobacter sp.]
MRAALRASFAAATAVVLIAADDPDPDALTWDEPAARGYPDSPAAIKGRIEGSRFEPGDFSYLRGAFPGASAEEIAEFTAIKAWVEQCRAEGMLRREAELEELGLELKGEGIRSGASLCEQVVLPGPWILPMQDWQAVEAGLPAARLVFNTMVDTIDKTELRLWPMGGDFARELELRTIGDQILRLSLSKPIDGETDRRVPVLDDNEEAVLAALVWSELAHVDFGNTAWLRREVAKRGWPKQSEVGEKASNAAWLIVQHADHDPAFQYRALKLMEPLVEQREVSPQEYAYLYDRVMLKLAGKQRYATQVTCEGGQRVARPLEEPERVDGLRAEVGLEPFAEYLTWFPSSC